MGKASLGGGDGFFQVSCKIEHHLYWLAGVLVLVIAVHVCLELLAVAHNLIATLLERYMHVGSACTTNVIPERLLLRSGQKSGRMIYPYTAPLVVGVVFFSHSAGQVFRALRDNGICSWFPVVVSY